MTICVITCVPDGIVMGIDSRLTENITYPDGRLSQKILSDTHQKIWMINKNVGLTAHNTFDYMGKDLNVIIDEFIESNVKEDDQVYLVAYRFYGFLRKYYPTLETQFWLAGYEEDEPYVIYIHKDENCRRNIENGKISYETHFGGNTKIAFGLWEKIRPKFNKMSLARAIEYVEFSIEATIKSLSFSNSYSNCGGQVNILVITKESVRFYEEIQDVTQ
ncbi:hypothetical protein [Oceanobacillus sp. FSL W7-1309]|uniref:hypothetical protein n=1 Tax=Oceanobacillus sp. FSL W7-1309 TaxID=2954539 RepID=UPI0030F989D9